MVNFAYLLTIFAYMCTSGLMFVFVFIFSDELYNSLWRQ